MTFLAVRLGTVSICGCITLSAPGVFAQPFDAVRLHAAEPGKDGGTLSAVVVAGTAYQGSDKRRTLVLPVLDYQWVNGWFAGLSNGIGYNFSGSPQMQYGLRLTADLGRKENRANALHGMGDIDAAAEGGAFFNYSLSPSLFVTSSMRYGAGVNRNGLVVDIGAGYSTAFASRWRLGVGTAITMANADYMQSYFGVTPAQSTTSGYVAYKPSAGARDVRANIALTYSVDRRTAVTTALSASNLLNVARDSPLARRRTAASGVLAVSYAF